MRITFCWSEISGYMAACWRALSARPDVDLSIIAWSAGGANPFADEIVRGLRVRLLAEGERENVQLIHALVAEQKPDVIVIGGWQSATYRLLTTNPRFSAAKFVMGMDTPWRNTLRQRLGRYRMGGYFRRLHRVMVPGERAWQLGLALGIPEWKLRRGMYGIDCTLLEPLHAQRLHQPGGWPRRFLFAGRYVEEKGLDVLIDGYARYRRTTNDPWPLTCCGSGPMNAQLTAEGVENLGFVQPQDLAAVMARAGAFVLPSRYDPWPLVIAEACAAGLPVICTEACGSAVELVRNLYSGWTVPTEDAASLARAMASADRKHQDLPEIGRRAQSFAAAYSAPVWADRWKVILTELSA